MDFFAEGLDLTEILMTDLRTRFTNCAYIIKNSSAEINVLYELKKIIRNTNVLPFRNLPTRFLRHVSFPWRLIRTYNQQIVKQAKLDDGAQLGYSLVYLLANSIFLAFHNE